jgi:hypothetical protein
MPRHKLLQEPDLPTELMSGLQDEIDRVKKARRYNPDDDDGQIIEPDVKYRRGRATAVQKVTAVALTDNKYKSWRNLLRPRYVRVDQSGRVRIVPTALHAQHVMTLSASGGPYFGNAFTFPLSRNNLQDAEYWPEGKKRGYCVDVNVQWDMIRFLLRVRPESGVYIVSSEIRGLHLKQIVFTLLMHTTYALNAKHVRWAGLYSTFRDSLRDDKPILDALVLDNIHAGMDNTKWTKLRDVLHIYSAIPVFLVMDGLSPLEFAMKDLHIIPRMILNIGTPGVPKYIKSI